MTAIDVLQQDFILHKETFFIMLCIPITPDVKMEKVGLEKTLWYFLYIAETNNSLLFRQ